MIIRLLFVVTVVVAHSNQPPIGGQQNLQQGHHAGRAQQHQQPPQQQHQQQPPVQQQQHQQAPQQQHQQPPVQQHQQQPNIQQQQQPPMPQPPAHNFGTEQELHDREHIKQHLANEINIDESQMTNEQLQFHYFKMHDSDNNNKLDGIELVKAITHLHDDGEGHEQQAAPPAMAESELEDMIDNILKDDDFNQDGYIDYSEFLKAQGDRAAQAETTGSPP